MATQDDTARAYAAWLSELYDGTARWREQKAEAYPDDPRNARAARALRAAAAYLRGVDDPLTLIGVKRLVEFTELLERYVGPREPQAVVTAAGPAVSRFFFDNGSADPQERHFNLLVLETLHETLESWRGSIEDGNMQPPAALVEFFDDYGLPLWQHETDDDDGPPLNPECPICRASSWRSFAGDDQLLASLPVVHNVSVGRGKGTILATGHVCERCGFLRLHST